MAERRKPHGQHDHPPTRRRLETAAAVACRPNGRSMEDEARNILRTPPPPRNQGGPRRAAPLRRRAATSATRAAWQIPAGLRHRHRRVLLIIGGGIAAYKSLDLIRRLRERGLAVRCMLTPAAQEFITPLAAGALSGERVFTELFDTSTEYDVGHIRLARAADLVVVAPATADLMARMAGPRR